MAHILHIDTSADNGFVAFAHDGKLIASKDIVEARNQAAILNNDISEVIKHAGIHLNELDAIAVCGGPGSYTGLRISLSTSKAICYALDKPLMMHDKLLLLTLNNYYAHLSAYDIYVSILPARDNEYFISAHDNKLNAIISPKHIFSEEIAMIFNGFSGKILTNGNILEAHLNQLSVENIDFLENNEINKQAWAQYGFEKYNCNDFVNLSAVEPFYLKQVYTHKQKKIN